MLQWEVRLPQSLAHPYPQIANPWLPTYTCLHACDAGCCVGGWVVAYAIWKYVYMLCFTDDYRGPLGKTATPAAPAESDFAFAHLLISCIVVASHSIQSTYAWSVNQPCMLLQLIEHL